jgi:cytochrome c biogenesis protein CcmG/thiol:disulfide interchange protein DsbE
MRVGPCAIIVVVAILLNGCRPAAPEAGSGAAASPAPDFTLKQFGGQQIALADLRGRPVVLNFWASWCVPCREEMPLFEQEWRAAGNQGPAFVGVAMEDDEQSLTSFLRAYDVTYPAGLDFDGRIARAYEVKGLPTTIIISPEGKVLHRWQGPIDRERLDTFVAEARGA